MGFRAPQVVASLNEAVRTTRIVVHLQLDTEHSGVKHTARPMQVVHDVAPFWSTPEMWTDRRSSGLDV